MAIARRVTYFKTRIEDKPGALLVVLKELKAKNLGLIALWATPGEAGWTNLYIVPKNPERVRSFLEGASLPAEDGTTLFVKGTDRTGALVKMLEAIDHAGVNLVQTNAIAVGDRYGTFFIVSTHDIDNAARALGAK